MAIDAEPHHDDYVPFDKSRTLPVADLYDTAWSDFSARCDEHDPLNELTFEDQAAAFARARMETLP